MSWHACDIDQVVGTDPPGPEYMPELGHSGGKIALELAYSINNNNNNNLQILKITTM
jgi:hypothetical protein